MRTKNDPMKKSPVTGPASIPESAKSTTHTTVGTWIERSGPAWTLAVLALILLIFGVFTPTIFSQGAWIATAIAATQLLILAVGQTFIISTGGIDLSVGSVLGLSGIVGAWVMRALMTSDPGLSALWVVVIGFLAGILCGLIAGLVNGIVITHLGVPPLITTLGMLTAAMGVAYLVGSGQQISEIPDEITVIGFTNILGWFPVPLIVASAIALGGWYTLTFTKFGRRTLAIGSNPNSARRAGINLKSHLLKVYSLAGGLAGVAGMLLVSRLAAASPGAGDGQELNAIAAVVIGGTSLVGGRASVFGTVIGVFIIAVIQTALVIAAVEPFWQYVAVGVVLILAVWADQQRLKFIKKRK